MRMVSRPSDEGSILLWVVGCAAVGLLVAVATTQIVVSMHQHRTLQFATDAAILAAANELQLATFKVTGVISDIDVGRTSALAAATRSLQGESFTVKIEEFSVTDRLVTLRTSRTIDSPFGWGATASTRIYADSSVSVIRMP